MLPFNQQFVVRNLAGVFFFQGTSSQVKCWLDNNVASQDCLANKVVQFSYKKEALPCNYGFPETKTVKVEEVTNEHIKGYDCSLPVKEGFRTYRFDRIVGEITVLN